MARSIILESQVRMVDVDGGERLLDGIRWNTKVGELLDRLYPQASGRAREEMKVLEVWRGCVNVLEDSQRVSSVLSGWGYGDEGEGEVQLVVVKRSRLWSYHLARQHLKRQKYRCGKVSRRKLLHQNSGVYHRMGRSKKAMTEQAKKTLNLLETQQLELSGLLTPSKQTETPSLDLDSYPEGQRKEAERLIEAITEEITEKEDAFIRKKELAEKIASQQKELTEAQTNVSELEAKLLNEQHKLANLAEVKGPPEVDEIHKETARIKNELKVRTKLNKMLSTKMQELTGAVIQVEEELKLCSQEIELLKLSTPL